MERLYGTLFQQFRVALYLARHHSASQLIMTAKALCIIHHVVVEKRRSSIMHNFRWQQ